MSKLLGLAERAIKLARTPTPLASTTWRIWFSSRTF